MTSCHIAAEDKPWRGKAQEGRDRRSWITSSVVGTDSWEKQNREAGVACYAPRARGSVRRSHVVAGEWACNVTARRSGARDELAPFSGRGNP
jgi:hypothetical protein